MADSHLTQSISDEDLYRSCAPALMRFATVLVGADDAPDVVSSAVLNSLRSPRWPSVANRGGYLHRAVENEARNLRRRESRRREREQKATLRAVDLPVDSYPEVLDAVRRLSVRQRAVIYLAYWEDMTDEMIGDCLGISAGSARRHLARGRRHLRRVLDGQQ